MKKHKISNKDGTASFTITIDGQGLLRAFEIEGSYEPDKAATLTQMLFKDALGTIKYYKQKHPKLIQEIRSTVPSFMEFWEEYDYKLDRKIAEDRWKKLNDIDKIDAFEYIAVYAQERIRSGAKQKYAKTYLFEKPWRQ